MPKRYFKKPETVFVPFESPGEFAKWCLDIDPTSVCVNRDCHEVTADLLRCCGNSDWYRRNYQYYSLVQRPNVVQKVGYMAVSREVSDAWIVETSNVYEKLVHAERCAKRMHVLGVEIEIIEVTYWEEVE